VPRSALPFTHTCEVARYQMRLLDLIAQGRTAPIRIEDGGTLPGAERFQLAVRHCPLRYVLADELARCATELAFSEGDHLTSCLDLIRVPAQTLWIEWLDAARRTELPPRACNAAMGEAHRAGALLKASPNGRSGEMRAFWSTREELAYVSPVIIRFNLDGAPEHEASSNAIARSGLAKLVAPPESGLEEFLDHLQFYFQEEWACYYRERLDTPKAQYDVLVRNLETCAFDPPMLFAFLLLLSARSALPQRPIAVDKLNRARQRAGKLSLLEHVEVCAPLYSPSSHYPAELRDIERRSPRLHHVRGHIVRRGAAVFWRAPHLRGSARLGQIRTRTVELSFSGVAARA
jgi:hypothetical protein